MAGEGCSPRHAAVIKSLEKSHSAHPAFGMTQRTAFGLNHTSPKDATALSISPLVKNRPIFKSSSEFNWHAEESDPPEASQGCCKSHSVLKLRPPDPSII